MFAWGLYEIMYTISITSWWVRMHDGRRMCNTRQFQEYLIGLIKGEALAIPDTTIHPGRCRDRPFRIGDVGSQFLDNDSIG